MRAVALILALSLPLPAQADVAEAVRDHVLPGFAAFDSAAGRLAQAAQATCDPAALLPAWHDTYDAWMAVQHLRLGPTETDGRALAVLFWPDPKGLGQKAQAALLAAGTDAPLAADTFAQQSVAARGLLALERLLIPPAPLTADPCPLIRATAADLARTANLIRQDWDGGFSDLLLTAGQPGNTAYLSLPEARQALFTQLATGLEFLDDQRLGRPLGTFDAPQPTRAEARAAHRPLRNVTLSLQAMRGLAAALSPDAAPTLAAFDHAIELALALDDPDLAGVADPSGRLRIEILQQAVDAARDAVLADLGPRLGVGVGFNAADGD